MINLSPFMAIYDIVGLWIQPLTSYSDLTLLCGANEGPLQGGSLSAKISQLYLLDVLYVEYFKRTKEESVINKESTATAVIEKLL